MYIRQGSILDLDGIYELGQSTWAQYQTVLDQENWEKLAKNISNKSFYESLLMNSTCFVCENASHEIVGMSFIVASGTPFDVFSADQSYIRFVTVSPKYRGMQLGRQLTEKCIEHAKSTGEKKVALHTSEFMDSARHIYEKLGFKVLKEIEPRFNRKYWLYELIL